MALIETHDLWKTYLMGEEDHMFLPPVRRSVSRHRHSRLQVLEDSGHVCNVDQADLFNRFAIDFMKRGLAVRPGAA